MNNSIKNIALILILLFSFTGCSPKSTSAETAVPSSRVERRLKILATNPIIRNMITSVSGEFHDTDCLVEDPGEIKMFVPDLNIITGKEYDAIFYIGADYEPFMERIISSTDRNRVNVVNISRGIDILRYKENKLESLNYYYLTNSENYQISLFSVKNALQEMDWARSSLYDENFEKISRELDEFQKELKSFIDTQKDIVFVSDTDFTAYICQEYHEPHKRITEYRSEMENPATSKSSSTMLKEKAIFLYTDDSSLKKYADDIITYRLKPVKITLYDYNTSMIEVYKENFRRIKEAVENNS